MSVVDILLWKDPRKTGPIFVSLLLLLYSFQHFTVVTVITYLLKISLLPTLLFRLAISLKAAVTKTECEHPFKELLDTNIDVMIYGSTSDKGMPQALKIFLNECRRILLVEDVIDTVKVLIIVHLLSYLGDWFSGLTLLYMCVFVAFTIPKFYDVYREEILRILEKATNVMEDAKDKILSFIPSKSKSPSWKKGNGIKASGNTDESITSSGNNPPSSPTSRDEDKVKSS